MHVRSEDDVHTDSLTRLNEHLDDVPHGLLGEPVLALEHDEAPLFDANRAPETLIDPTRQSVSLGAVV